jgi:hypothetical protein
MPTFWIAVSKVKGGNGDLESICFLLAQLDAERTTEPSRVETARPAEGD